MPLRDVCGQDRAVRMLAGMISRQRIASTYLFAGPAGTGKLFTAMQFIKALNCEAPRDVPNVSGASGVSGVSGTASISSTSGVSGVSGISGTAGVSGISGVSGTSGVSGETSFGLFGSGGSLEIDASGGIGGLFDSGGIGGSPGSTGSGGSLEIDASGGIGGLFGSGGVGGSPGSTGSGGSLVEFGGAGGIDGAGIWGDACGACISCRKLDSKVAVMHPDLRVVKPLEGMIRIEDVRELEGFLSFTPLEGRWKTVVVEDADMMNMYAANAFLKTLEEPPAHSVIILLAAREDGLPDTVRSRAMRIGFVPLSVAAVTTIAGRLGLKIPSGRPVLSIGSVGSAVGDEVLEGRNRAFALLKAMISGGAGSTPWKDREDMEEWFEVVFVLLRDMAAIKVAGGSASGVNGGSASCVNGGSASGVNGGSASCVNEISAPRVNWVSAPGVIGGPAPLPINHDIADDLARMCKAVDLKVIIECYEKLLGISGRFVFNPGEKIVANYVGELLRNSFGRG